MHVAIRLSDRDPVGRGGCTACSRNRSRPSFRGTDPSLQERVSLQVSVVAMAVLVYKLLLSFIHGAHCLEVKFVSRGSM